MARLESEGKGPGGLVVDRCDKRNGLIACLFQCVMVVSCNLLMAIGQWRGWRCDVARYVDRILERKRL